VFLSHTSELAAFPQGRSFVRAAEQAVIQAGHAVIEMAYFAARDEIPAEYCEREVRKADVYVGVIGFRYGSPVRDRPDVSYTELEYETAGDAGLTRLVFLIGEDTEAPRKFFEDSEYRDRQDAFRSRVTQCAVAPTVSSPDELTTKVLHALTQLKDKDDERQQPDRTPDEHPWVRAVREHGVWDLSAGSGTEAARDTDAVRDAEAAREATAALVEALAAGYERDTARLADDPWWDRDMALRMADRVGWLARLAFTEGSASAHRPASAAAEPVGLSAAEAALLAAFPFVHEAFWASCAADLSRVVTGPAPTAGGQDRTRKEFERFAAGFPRLQRRLGRLVEPGGSAQDALAGPAIRWWLFHRWLVRWPEVYKDAPRRLAGLAAHRWPAGGRIGRVMAEVFAPGRLAALVRTVRLDADDVIRPGRTDPLLPTRELAGGTAGETRLREQLTALLLLAAHRFAIEPAGLPEVVADHLGIADPVRAPDVVATVRGTSWRQDGRTRVLGAACSHQAVGVALSEHAAGLTALLHEVDSAAAGGGWLAPLSRLPGSASAGDVRAATDAGGRPAYDGQGFRFRLADDRVQELLMGEQLYGERALAIRELYQNALDACRYRQARLAYLRRTGRTPAPWQGRIRFEHGTDEHGRPYLDCTDNGVGMSRHELVEVFSNAGIRFRDLPEFIEEQADWESAGVPFHPNSRFGIGVLSYFMLADEITVTTCRAGRDGRPGQPLRVRIAGPGVLARIQPAEPGRDASTTVRLHLRPGDPPVSAVDLLSRVLWISDFEVTAGDGTREATWTPGRLSELAPIGAKDPLEADARRAVTAVSPTQMPTLWWCAGTGAVLADGLWSGQSLFGAVVNLAGPHVPTLTLDRRRTVHHDAAEVERILHTGIPALLSDGGAAVRSLAWLAQLAASNLALADEISDESVARHARWRIGGADVDVSGIGCFPPDDQLFPGAGPASARSRQIPVPETVARWRLFAWAHEGLIPGLTSTGPAPPIARPSDGVLTPISRDLNGQDSWLEDGQGPWLADGPVPAGHVLGAAVVLGWSVARVAGRLGELGWQVPDRPWPQSTPTRDELTLTSRNLDRQGPWLADGPVPAGHVLRAAVVLGWPVARVAGRLGELGWQVPDALWPQTTPTRDELTLTSRDLTGRDPWLADGPVPAWHVLRAAAVAGWPVARVAGRLGALGWQVPDRPWPQATPTRDDRTLTSRDLDGRGPWLADGPVPAGHVLGAAVVLGWPVARVAGRLGALGWQVPDRPWPQSTPTRDERTLTSRNLDGQGPWLADGPVPAWHVLRAAVVLGWPVARVAGRLVELGMTLVPGLHVSPSADHNGRGSGGAGD
jgi:hypothetical protein